MGQANGKEKDKRERKIFLISTTPCEIFNVCSDLTRVEYKMKEWSSNVAHSVKKQKKIALFC